jgi:hypothetical protein
VFVFVTSRAQYFLLPHMTTQTSERGYSRQKKRCEPGIGVSVPETDGTRAFAPAGHRGTWRGENVDAISSPAIQNHKPSNAKEWILVPLGVVVNANNLVARPHSGVVKDDRLHAMLTDDPATLACQSKRKIIPGVYDLIKNG